MKIHLKQSLTALSIAAMGLTAFGLTEEAVAEYWPVAEGRAAKIVDGLAIEDPTAREQVKLAVAGQYRDLFIIHESRDEALKQIGSYDHGFQVFTENARAGIEKGSKEAIEKLHREYIARLSALVDAETVNAIKDGMTYGVAPKTYKVYLAMLPELTAEQRAQIQAWLLEAREYAMDGGSSDEKHKWFGKYKGRINNYLSSLGYDMKAAEKAMFDRIKAEKQKEND
ncbi:MAG TPA: DUF3826 domain-containing protein [Oceanipulchritudo sp.]|nr:DUF3826 domain-containing protein [Oceanipulchritudo sp.]